MKICNWAAKYRKMLALFLALVMIFPGGSLTVCAADLQYYTNVTVYVDGVRAGEIPALEDTYENHLYLSLKGFAYCLRGSQKAFSAAVEKRRITITTKESAPESAPESPLEPPAVWAQKELGAAIITTASKYELTVDETERKYYSFLLARGKEYDAFLAPVSLAMLFDLDIQVSKDRVEIRTGQPFVVSAKEMEEAGYFQGVNSLLVGDAATGEIYYQYDGEEVVAIASTSKLMTFMIFMEAVERGECTLQDVVRISAKAAKLSVGSDGVLAMKEGSEKSVNDLLYGMLMLSSNECALALAEHAAGSEEAFVERMNERAQQMGLWNARFYNCHGLPVYRSMLLPAKVQNRMTAQEMFQLCSVLLETFPEVTDYTSKKYYYLDDFGLTAWNYNAVLYNMEQAVGLKTGTTNKAGACLVTCVTEQKDGQTHPLIVVLFGADGDENRGILSELCARYAIQRFREGGADQSTGDGAGHGAIPADPEIVIKKLIAVSANL